ncbi:hypothetical protein PIB30_065852 [Stylosanthes scabra]|uniref:Uncharacterized protein n=1 Tax=Stylosanthes scabra TaxID=79078 RepID=A0ABU6WMV8_9FABA|nr:hypothetical protein [Stylosanthes scabra]
MGGVSFEFSSGCACISDSARHGVCFSIRINFTLIPLERDSCLFALTRVESSLTLLKSLSKSLSGITLKSCLFLLSGRSSWMMKSLPAGLGKKSNFKCHWILDHNDADVGAFRALSDSLLKDMEKQSRFDHLMQRMKEVERAGPRSILPSSKAQTTVSGVSASGPLSTSSIPPVSSSGASKATGKPTSAVPAKPFSVEREEGVKEDPAADLRQKRRKRKVSEASAEVAALGGDSARKHKVNPIDRAFRRTTISGLLWTLALRMLRFVRFLSLWFQSSCLGPLSSLLANSPLSFRYVLVCVEKTFAAKVQLEKELAAAREQVDVLTVERDSALAAPLLHAKIKSLTEELERAEGERLSATKLIEEVERKAKAQSAELESCRSALTQEEKKVESLSQSLKGKQMALDEAEAAAVHWRDEWRSLGEETREMDPKAKRIYNPKAEAQDQPEPVVKQPEPEAEEQRAEEVVAGEGGVGYVPSSRNLASLYGAELLGALSECFDHSVGAFPVCS